ncbi:IS66 family transposase [Thiorhodococcus minor]|uniref:Transposase n=1 Tax=Thiorhodococcus minor TaxID=57489 RepID=A0A6M0JXQ3_9GAMM|nr:transposase [Thiorhodococcus minor]NEV60885.1 transposase [Thiorhodococcus minor]
MHLSDHSLNQLDEAYVQSLDEGQLRGLSLRLLDDLKEARERLRQNPSNSSRPPSSRAPWDRPSSDEDETDETSPEATTAADDADEPPEETSAEADSSAQAPAASSDAAPASADTDKPKRKAGKQPGAPGVGRTQVLKAQRTREHRPEVCAACGEALPAEAASVAYAGFQSVDLVWGDPEQPGLHLQVTDHRLFDTRCACAHHTRARPGEGQVEDPTLQPAALSEWRLVGPGLATLIVALHLRFRMSRRRIREFLHDWLALSVSVGTLDQTLREAAAAVTPLEAELIDAVVASDLLHADETSWWQGAELLWLWVFTSTTVTLFMVAQRGRALLDRLLPGFDGWLMSDGWQAYRHLPKRLRCWAHLTRKAQGLIDSDDREAQAFGHQVQDAFDTLIGAIHAAREGPPGDLPRIHAALLAELHAACVRLLGHRHAKTRALAVELWNDWEAIFRVLENPQWPLTNNDAYAARSISVVELIRSAGLCGRSSLARA